MNRRERCMFLALVALGSVQMLAEVFNFPRIKALAAASQMSPAMKVFTAHQGYETHAARFHIGWCNAASECDWLILSPANYSQIAGPYNRRNVYGAALAYGPLLRADSRLRGMHSSVMAYAFCMPGSLRVPLGMPKDVQKIWVHVEPLRASRSDLDYAWETDCAS